MQDYIKDYILNENIGDFNPTNIIVSDALDCTGNIKTIALAYCQTDNWLGSISPCGISEELGARLIRLMREDSAVVSFQNRYYRKENGIFKSHMRTVPVVKVRGYD